MYFQTRYFLILTLVCCFGWPVYLRAQLMPLDTAVRMGRLPNGLTYIIRHNGEPKQRVGLYLVNKVGSILEDEDQRGLAHFMEHMNFNGTKHYPRNQLEDFLQKAGVRFGADLNAYTNYDETVYVLPIPTSDPEMLGKGLGILRDWAQDALLDSTDIAQERGVVLEEERLRLGVNERMQQKCIPVLWNHSRYAERNPIGLHSVLTSFGPEQIRRFHRDWYRPDLQAVIVVGDIDVSEVEQAIKKQFGDLKNPVHEKPRPVYSVALTGKNQFLIVTDKELSTTSLQIAIKHKAPDIKTLPEYRAAIVQSLFGMLLSGRFAELSRQNDPPFLNGNAGITGLQRGLDAFSVSVTARPGALEKGFKAVWREVCRVQRYGFTQSELDRAEKNYLSSVDAMVREKDKISSDDYIKEYVQLFLNGTPSPGTEKENELVHQLLPGISLKDMDSVVLDYVKDRNRDIILLAPEKDSAGLPREGAILSWISEVNKEALTPYKDEVDVQPLLQHQPVPGKIVRSEKDSVSGLTTLTLSNGIKVILKKTDFQNNQILFSGFSEGGTSLYADSDFQSASNAAMLVALSGVGNYNPLLLGKLTSGKQMSVGTYIADRTQGVSGGASPEDLGSALELMYAYFTEPRMDEALFRGQIENTKLALADRYNDPNNVFSDTVQAITGNYNIRRTGPSVEKLNQINVRRAFEIYKERFADASGFSFVFVGNIDEEKLRPLLEKYMASLPATGVRQEARDLGLHIPEGRISKTVYKGKEQKATVLLLFSGPFDYNYDNIRKLGALKEVLTIRLLEKLREEEGGVYTPGVQINVSKYPESRFSLTVSFGCSPANVEKLIQSTLNEINQLKKHGPSAVDLDKFKAESRNELETALKTNGFWMSYLTGQLMNKEPLEQFRENDAVIKQMTPQRLQEMISKYVSDNNFIRLVLMPEVKP